MAFKVTIASLLVVLAAAVLPSLASRLPQASPALATHTGTDVSVGGSVNPASVADTEQNTGSTAVASARACIVDATTEANCSVLGARWASSNAVDVCLAANAGEGLDVFQLEGYVLSGIDAWNGPSVGAALLVYSGECEGAYGLPGDGVNEIGFDESGTLVRPELAKTQSTILLLADGRMRPTILEADILLSRQLVEIPACLQSAITHELGHLLGLGHSEEPTDIMFATITLADITTCETAPSTEDAMRLRELYAAALP